MQRWIQTYQIARKNQPHNTYRQYQIISQKKKKALETLIQAARIYSDDIEMEFGIEKCHAYNKKRKTANDRKNGNI